MWAFSFYIIAFAATCTTVQGTTIELNLTDGGEKRVVNGTTSDEYILDDARLGSTGTDIWFGASNVPTVVECGPIGSVTNVTMGFRAYIGPAYPDYSTRIPVITDLEFIYDFGETSYVHKVDDSEAPIVGTNYSTAEPYIFVENYIYQDSAIYDTKFGWRFAFKDDQIHHMQLSPLFMDEGECVYNYKTSAPTMATTFPPTMPTSSAPSRIGKGHSISAIILTFVAANGLLTLLQ